MAKSRQYRIDGRTFREFRGKPEFPELAGVAAPPESPLFFVLPPRLLAAVAPILRAHGDQELLAFEEMMSSVRKGSGGRGNFSILSNDKVVTSDEFSKRVEERADPTDADQTAFCPIWWWQQGFRPYPLLRDSDASRTGAFVESDPFLKELAAEWGKEPAAVMNAISQAEPLLDKGRIAAAAYCGWLLLNRRFLAELDELLGRWGALLRKSGMPDIPAIHTATFSTNHVPESPTAEQLKMSEEFAKFFLHWRLDGMPAPYLPIPLQSQGPVLSPKLMDLAGHGGSLFYFSEVLPLPSGQDLRNWIEDALQRKAPEHLAEWMQIVGSSNPAKNQLDSYARRFAVQHYWRVLHLRHARALHQKKTELEYAFSQYFGVSESTMHADLLAITDALGPDWYKQQDVLEQFCGSPRTS